MISGRVVEIRRKSEPCSCWDLSRVARSVYPTWSVWVARAEGPPSYVAELHLRIEGLARYRVLSPEDEVTWWKWLAQPTVDTFVDEMIEQCAALAKFAEGATGWAESPADPGEDPGLQP